MKVPTRQPYHICPAHIGLGPIRRSFIKGVYLVSIMADACAQGKIKPAGKWPVFVARGPERPAAAGAYLVARMSNGFSSASPCVLCGSIPREAAFVKRGRSKGFPVRRAGAFRGGKTWIPARSVASVAGGRSSAWSAENAGGTRILLVKRRELWYDI